jgi:predicted amidohydrolase
LNSVSISLLQTKPDGRDAEARLRGLAARAPRDTDVMLLPESPATVSRDESARFLDALSRVCAERQCFAISGGMPWAEGGRLTLRTWVIGDAGETVAWYDKAHLSSSLGEDRLYSPGDGAGIFRARGADCAALSGYDLLFPEYCRQISLAGARIFFVSANMPDEFAGIWEALIRSAAFTNQCFIAACDGAGGSAAVSPSGEILAAARDGGEVVSFSIKPSDADMRRKKIPLERDRRGKIYALFK